MKTRKMLVLFVAVCTVAALWSCGGSMNPSKLFVKKWQFDSFKSKAYDQQMAMFKKALDTTKDSSTRSFLQQRLAAADQQLQESKKTILTTNLDGTYQMSVSQMGKDMTLKGKWSLTPDGKEAIMKDDNHPKNDTLHLSLLTAEKMVITIPDGAGDSIYITYKAI